MTDEKLIEALMARALYEENGGCVERQLEDAAPLLNEAADRLSAALERGKALEGIDEAALMKSIRTVYVLVEEHFEGDDLEDVWGPISQAVYSIRRARSLLAGGGK